MIDREGLLLKPNVRSACWFASSLLPITLFVQLTWIFQGFDIDVGPLYMLHLFVIEKDRDTFISFGPTGMLMQHGTSFAKNGSLHPRFSGLILSTTGRQDN